MKKLPFILVVVMVFIGMWNSFNEVYRLKKRIVNLEKRIEILMKLMEEKK